MLKDVNFCFTLSVDKSKHTHLSKSRRSRKCIYLCSPRLRCLPKCVHRRAIVKRAYGKIPALAHPVPSARPPPFSSPLERSMIKMTRPRARGWSRSRAGSSSAERSRAEQSGGKARAEKKKRLQEQQHLTADNVLIAGGYDTVIWGIFHGRTRTFPLLSSSMPCSPASGTNGVDLAQSDGNASSVLGVARFFFSFF